MEYIATAALVVIAVCAVMVTKAFIEFIEGFREFHFTVHLSDFDRNILSNFRRRKPVVKKETE